MTERSNAGVAHALRDGFWRVAAAPAVAIGVYGALRLLDFSPEEDWQLVGGGMRATIAHLLFWAFVYGGLIDRYARNRPTRGFGFFGACGRHVMPLARLAIVPALVMYALIRIQPTIVTGVIVMLTVDVVLQFARIRLVVEDRRSALGSLLAGIRFIRRNFGAVVILWIVYGLLHVALGEAWESLRVSPDHPWTGRVVDEAGCALSLWRSTLFPFATGVALFQSRLAHAGYTAAPPAVWPESASAEAIANAAPRIPS